jgi:hypothetical protein
VGEGVVRLGGVPEASGFDRAVGDTDRGPESICIWSSEPPAAGGEFRVAEGSVAIGGRLIGPVLLLCEDNPAPIGRG